MVVAELSKPSIRILDRLCDAGVGAPARSQAVGRVDTRPPLESTALSRQLPVWTFCSSRRQPRARLTDCELKFQNISDCLRRLIAPLLVPTAGRPRRGATILYFSYRRNDSSSVFERNPPPPDTHISAHSRRIGFR